MTNPRTSLAVGAAFAAAGLMSLAALGVTALQVLIDRLAGRNQP